MNQRNKDVQEHSLSLTGATDSLPSLLGVGQVAAMLGCSARHVYRLCDGGKMPRPVKLGALNRWQREVVQEWVADGCPNVRKAGTR